MSHSMCKDCVFSSLEKTDPKLLTRIRVCRQAPPAVILVPTAVNTATAMRVFPPVQDTDWCHQFRALAPMES